MALPETLGLLMRDFVKIIVRIDIQSSTTNKVTNQQQDSEWSMTILVTPCLKVRSGLISTRSQPYPKMQSKVHYQESNISYGAMATIVRQITLSADGGRFTIATKSQPLMVATTDGRTAARN